ncbi:MAG: HpcH/HpaI aldolase/citrate lyase family protein [Clostridium sp.]
MIHFKFIESKLFYKEPNKFDKNTKKEVLKYALGANLYMNGHIDIYKKIISGEFSNLGSISICFEDSIKESDVEICENNVLNMLNKLNYYMNSNSEFNDCDIPLIFIRIRNYSQFINFTERLNKESIKLIAGFIFPKFNSKNGEMYLRHVRNLSHEFHEILYVMPILETEEIIYKESRIEELVTIKGMLYRYKDIILNIRVGGTDFSSKFGLRRTVDSNIYNVSVVSDCLIDIINMFLRGNEDYVISAPVWEYFSLNKESREIEGLINEIKLDKENGFCGKTIIHPSQAKYVNAVYAVSYEEYIDASNIMKDSEVGGVFKGYGGNKMNEVVPHLNWAKKTLLRAEVFGVLNEGISYDKLY